jgi:hypothetical protein
MAWRIGVYLLFISVILLVIFFGTDQVRQPVYGYFCLGMLLFLLGGYLMWRGYTRPSIQSQRFRLLRGSKEKKKSKGPESGQGSA